MATLEELKLEIAAEYSSTNDIQWTAMIREEGIERFTVEQLDTLISNYVQDITGSRQILRETGMQCTVVPCTLEGDKKTENLMIAAMHDFFGEIDAAIASEGRLFKSLALCLKQKERLGG